MALRKSIVLLLFHVLTQVHAVSAQSILNPPDSNRQAWFLAILKRLADEGGLSVPANVNRVLGENLTQDGDPIIHEKKCTKFGGVGTAERKFKISPEGWIKTGVVNLVSGPVTPIEKLDSVLFSYSIIDQTFCDEQISPANPIGRDVILNTNSSHVGFRGIQNFSCITLDNIQKALPVHFMGRTDASPERYHYYAEPQEEFGTVLEFGPFANGCLHQAGVSEFREFGRRYKRAEVKFRTCQRDAAKAFCDAPGTFGWRDFAAWDEMGKYIYQKCASLNDFYVREPTSNLTPPPPIHYRQTPCGS